MRRRGAQQTLSQGLASAHRESKALTRQRRFVFLSDESLLPTEASPDETKTVPLRPSTSSNAHRLLSQNGLVHDGDDGDVVAVAVALAVDVDVDVVPASVAVVVAVAAFAVAVAVAVAVVARSLEPLKLC